MTSPVHVYEQALAVPRDWRLRAAGGDIVSLDERLRRWRGGVDLTDRELLARCRGTVLDIGCGPGRLVGTLHGAGTAALGVDIAAGAVRMARATGASVVHASVFDPLPSEGSWDTVLLADGNIGIGGDPVILLRRCAELVSDAGRLLVEVDPPGSGASQVRLRLESGTRVSAWFRWAHVAVDVVHHPAAAAGLSVAEVWTRGRRWFAELTR